MNKRNTIGSMVALMATLVMALLVSLNGPFYQARAAPAAAITPVAAEDPTTGEVSNLVRFYDAEPLTASDQSCIDLREYRVIDLEYIIDQGETNTATLTLEHTNGAGADLTTNTAGQAIVSSNTSDADDLNRYDLFGVYTCVDVNLTNTETLTVTVYGLARK